MVDDFDDICEFVNSSRVTVTGELGDQLFGSNTMRRAVDSPEMDLAGPWTQPEFWAPMLNHAVRKLVHG